MKRFKQFNQRGETLIQVLIALGVTSILVLSIISFLNFSSRAEKNVRAVSNFSDLMTLVQMGLDDIKACTMNLKGQKLKPDNPNSPHEVELHFLNSSTGQKGELITKMGAQHQLIDVQSVRLYMKERLPSGRAIGMIKVTGQKKGDVLGSKVMAEPVPIYVTLDPADVITQCYGNYSAGGVLQLQEKICSLTTNGDFYYDAVNDRCAERPVQCFDGSQYAASCGSGATKLRDSQPCWSNVVDNDTRTISRTYGGGRKTRDATAPPPIDCEVSGPMSVTCDYADGITPGTCQACCYMNL